MKSKKFAVTSLIAVFTLGLALGFASNRIFSTSKGKDQRSHKDHTTRSMVKLKSELDLTEEQSTQLREFLDELKEKVAQIRKESRPHYERVNEEFKEEFRIILTEEQKEKFSQMCKRSKDKSKYKER